MAKKPLKLITLNAWGGRAMEPLLNFFLEKSDEVDIFCLQEVFDAEQSELDKRYPEQDLQGDMFEQICVRLPNHQAMFAYFDERSSRMSLAVFIRHGIKVKTIGDVIVHEPEQPKDYGSFVLSSRKAQYMTIEHEGEAVSILNYHGLWNGGGKGDTDERFLQSERVRTALDKLPGKKILCGDFNLLPDTKSLAMMGEGMQDLVKEYKVPATRTKLYRHFDNTDEPNFADYVFASPDVEVQNFEVLPDEVSDHAALMVDFA